MTGPGDLNRRLALEEPVETADGAGGVTRSYRTVATVWASLAPLSARYGVTADHDGTGVVWRIVIRAGRDVTTRHRFRDGARIFAVDSVREQSGPRRFLDIRVTERAD